MNSTDTLRRRLPNAVYVGVARAGSTWLAENLAVHPDVFVPTAKDLYFFDREYGRGLDWYTEHFRGGEDCAVRIDISHDYLHVPIAAPRIAADLPDATILACVREPVDWLRSIVTYKARNVPSGTSFQHVLSQELGIVAGGFVSNYLRHWMHHIDPGRMMVYAYDDLKADPARTLDAIQDKLGLDHHMPTDVETRRNAPTQARSPLVARSGKAVAHGLRRIGRPEVLGRLKRSPVVGRLLYSQRLVDVIVTDEEVATLREFYRPEVEALSELLDRDFLRLWCYDPK